MADKSLQPSHEPHLRHLSHLWNSGKKKNTGWEGGKTLKELLHGLLHERSTKNSKILVVYKATSYHVCLHSWDWPLDAPKLVDRLTAKLVNRLTAKLVVVNVVHFAFNHICHLSSEPLLMVLIRSCFLLFCLFGILSALRCGWWG